jgi:hypothetical protein
VHCESRVAVAVVRRYFGNVGRGTSATGSWYQRASEGQKTEKTQCVCSELKTV